MPTPDAGYLNAPIPGMSLTTEPGNRPWENPPMLVTVEDAIEFYVNKIIADSNSHDAVLEMLELRLPVENIANLLNKMSIMEGYHTIDVGILVLPAIEEMIMAVADMHGVKYAESVGQIMKGFTPNPRAVRMAMNDLEKSMNAPEAPTTESSPMPMEEAAKGLMTRPKKGME
jgi:hypothetical protein